MAGYNVTTPPLFTVRDPLQLLQFNLNTLNATMAFPDKEDHVEEAAITQEQQDAGYVSGTAYLITAENLLHGFVVCTGPSTVSRVEIDTASNIIDALRRKMWRLTNLDQFANGAHFRCVLQNSTTGSLDVYSNNVSGEVQVGGSQSQIAIQATAFLDIVVLDQARLNTTTITHHTDRVFVCISRCATEIAPVYD